MMNIIFRHQKCNICSNDKTQRVVNLSIPEQFMEGTPNFSDVSVVRCIRCGFYYLEPMPMDGMNQLYDNKYFIGIYTEWWQKARMEVISKSRFVAMQGYVKSKKPRFLEIGCGFGYGLQEAKRRNWQIYGQDITDVFAKEIKEKLSIEIAVGELQQVNFQNNFFDVVYLDSVIEHLAHPVTMLNEIKRILKPTGLIYIITPNVDALINRIRDLIYKILRTERTSRLSPFEPPYHIVGFTEYSFKLMCQMTGFELKYLKIFSGRNEWRKHTRKNWNIKIKHLLYHPVYLVGEIIGSGITIEAIISLKLRN